MATGAPDMISSFGFARAPVSQFLVMASGFASVTVSLLPRPYQSLLTLRWFDVLKKKQGWRLVSSQFIADNYMDFVSNCVLIYYFLVLERRFGSSKYASFIIKTWSMSLGLYFVAMKSNLLDAYIPYLDVAPNGLYGPLAALLVQYWCDIPKGDSTGPFGIPISRKIFIYLIAFQMFISSEKTILISLCGITSGIIYKLNVLKLQDWTVPNAISSTLSKILSYFIKNEPAMISKRAFMGATAEIHEDMMFDHMMRRQQQLYRRGNEERTQHGQGYSDIVNPSFLNFLQPSPDNLSESRIVNNSPDSDEKIRALVEMGFSRDAVINALVSTDNDIQQATSILLSR